MRHLVITLVLAATPAIAHDWYTGLVNERGERCCGGEDCAPLDERWVQMLSPTEWEVAVPPGGLPSYRSEDHYFRVDAAMCELIKGATRPIVLWFHGNPGFSPDGQYQGCAAEFEDIPIGVLRCLFVGGAS